MRWYTTLKMKTRCANMIHFMVVVMVIIICDVKNASTATIQVSERMNNERESLSESITGIHNQPQPSLTAYDQRQSGKYNLRVHIKDVKIIAVNGDGLEDSLDDDTIYDYGDYDYDPAHLTVSPLPLFGIGSVSITSSKPPKLTTNSKPQSSTSASTISTTFQSTTELNALPQEVSSVSLSSEQTVSTTAKTTTTFKPSHISSNAVLKPIQAPGQYDYQEIPVQVIVERKH
ncbi:uncharacterized protein LOC121597191 [Anopheles merus]|uniref:uncharacterized protein LOC121597191 n=1 Tax=Anopheles merus TaxID=30066 RepID=UPI001BE4CB68|nr:uncharacterized protein LOC121597191 [Anopheles merus]XP_041778710.1 uncharacterized protein LOC121597191 [Anopheles merus]